MSRISGSALLIDEGELRSATRFIPKIARLFFYGLGITNDSYLERYRRFYHERFPDRTPKELSQKATADRKVLLDQKMTFNMLSGLSDAMGCDITAVQVEFKDRLTGEVMIFYSNISIDEFKKQIEEKKKAQAFSF